MTLSTRDFAVTLMFFRRPAVTLRWRATNTEHDFLLEDIVGVRYQPASTVAIPEKLLDATLTFGDKQLKTHIFHWDIRHEYTPVGDPWYSVARLGFVDDAGNTMELTGLINPTEKS